MSKLPNHWTDEELVADAAAARAIFREERLGEPLDLYNKFYGQFVDIFASIVPRLYDLAADPVDAVAVAEMVRGKDQQKSFRYLTAPPISEDDLKAVADCSIAPTILQNDAALAQQVRDVILSIIDPHRFPWMIVPRRQPTDREIELAIMSSAALCAAREVETHRRNNSKDVQENAVKDALRAIGMIEVPPRDIPILTKAPDPGHFCGESRIAGTRADVVARLADGRVMAIECKVSNSTVNSYKRIVHDTGGKAAHWYQQLGKAQVIPCAVLSGIMSPANLSQVQISPGVYFFWQNRLGDLTDYVNEVNGN